MITCTLGITINSIEPKYNDQQELTVFGEISFQQWEGGGVVDEQIRFRAFGGPAEALANSGVEGTGVAIGYPDLKVVDAPDGKHKVTTFIIRQFEPTVAQR
jgi:hypothetical protein